MSQLILEFGWEHHFMWWGGVGKTLKHILWGNFKWRDFCHVYFLKGSRPSEQKYWEKRRHLHSRDPTVIYICRFSLVSGFQGWTLDIGAKVNVKSWLSNYLFWRVSSWSTWSSWSDQPWPFSSNGPVFSSLSCLNLKKTLEPNINAVAGSKTIITWHKTRERQGWQE